MVRLLVEYPPSGGVLPGIYIRQIRAEHLWPRAFGTSCIVLESFFLAMLVMYIMFEMRLMYRYARIVPALLALCIRHVLVVTLLSAGVLQLRVCGRSLSCPCTHVPALMTLHSCSCTSLMSLHICLCACIPLKS